MRNESEGGVLIDKRHSESMLISAAGAQRGMHPAEDVEGFASQIQEGWLEHRFEVLRFLFHHVQACLQP